ncbi:hydroxylamine reductase [Vulcanibacillus modesticaldus]|uniref:Hydroxylamine reductase n=1 Tax=Vulcanibacillus modesticaldus TaxID=337097 RepID=A0A1D2YUT0_9BACI|nr:hydroxylamine reductase [Vulcanibacillus modesticaldus]OEF99468.1 hydroxylamine reductase [Vulcanibacillus modesticaldus]
MSMFCFQCQEASKNEGCTVVGVCGKKDTTANLQDLLIYVLKGISVYGNKAKEIGIYDEETSLFIAKGLFSTITNVNFNDDKFIEMIKEALSYRDSLKNKFMDAYKAKYGEEFSEELPEMATWYSDDIDEFYKKGEEVGVLATKDEDIRSLRELLTYGLKGIAAYVEHAYVLGEKSDEVFSFLQEGLAATTDDSLSAEELIGVILKTGEVAVKAMAMLDKANTSTYGHPEPTQVNIGVKKRPGILVSGHDLKDLEELLEQSKDKGVDIYTHGEMLPANTYPFFKKYDHFVGNYGNSWWEQTREFESFNGPILMTTNCLVPPKDSYKDRVYTTGVVGFPGVKHIEDRKPGQQKDFSAIIEHALKCEPPTEIETGTITSGFARNAVLSVADKVVDAVNSGAIKKFVVMAGCEGRHKTRDYYKQLAQELPQDAVILTAGCAKYRYNKLDLGDIGGIPRILDAGQCNDSYSLVVIAQALMEATGVKDINELPISYDIAWYEQKAVAVLLALLHLGVKGIRLGPTLPAFLSPNVVKVLVENFDIKPIGTVAEDLKAIMGEEVVVE